MGRALLLLPIALAALCLVPSNVGADVEPGRYKGKTTPGHGFTLRVTKSQRVLFLLTPRLRCSNGKRVPRGAAPTRPPKLDAAGRFRYRETGRARIGKQTARYRYRIRGRVRANVARGRFAAIEFRGSVTCRAKGRWVARRG